MRERCAPAPLPNDRDAKSGERSIVRHRRNAFDKCLCGEHAVERVFVGAREASGETTMFNRDGKGLEPVFREGGRIILAQWGGG